jgi:hypothetical protein
MLGGSLWGDGCDWFRVWRSQYNLTHKTILESLRTLLLDLANIKKVFVKKYNKKAKAYKAKVATASKAGKAHMHRKRANGGSSDQFSTKGHSIKYCQY